MNTKYYTIKDVADRTGMSPHTLRFYDKQGLLSFIKRSESGIRMFTEEDFEFLFVIQCLKRSGMPLKKIKEFTDLYSKGNSTIYERLIMFQQHRQNILNQIAELQEMLSITDYKCWFFEQAEKQGDVYYYRNLSEDQIPQQIKDFYKKVKDFSSDNNKI